MATKLNGKLNLSKIPQDCIFTDKNGDQCVYVDVIPVKEGTDKYGNTHTVSVYNKAERRATYLANLAPQEFGVPTAANQPAGQAPGRGYQPQGPGRGYQAPGRGYQGNGQGGYQAGGQQGGYNPNQHI